MKKKRDTDEQIGFVLRQAKIPHDERQDGDAGKLRCLVCVRPIREGRC